MADTSNLSNYLKDVADAIRAKKGTEDAIPAANFDTEIASITTSENLDDVLQEQTELINELEEILKTKSKTSATINVFMQETEPDIKNGIWIQDASNMIDSINISTLNGDNYTDITWDTSSQTITQYVYMSCFLLLNDDLYLLGGGNNANKFSKINLSTGEETVFEDLSFEVNDCGFCTVGSDIYLFGGKNTQNRAIKYNVLTKEMTSLTDIPYNSVDSFCAYYDGNIYIFGGSGDYTAAYKYSISENTYTQLTDITRGYNSNVSGCVYGNKVYLFGNGYNASRENCHKLTIYDLSNNTSQSITMPDYLAASACVNIGEFIYIIGNSFNIGTSPNLICYVYNITKNEFTKLDNLPKDTYYGIACCYKNKIYVGMTTSLYTGTLNLLDYEGANKCNIIAGSMYKTKLLDNLSILLNDVVYMNNQSVILNTLPTYYGDGTQWIKIKN